MSPSVTQQSSSHEPTGWSGSPSTRTSVSQLPASSNSFCWPTPSGTAARDRPQPAGARHVATPASGRSPRPNPNGRPQREVHPPRMLRRLRQAVPRSRQSARRRRRPRNAPLRRTTPIVAAAVCQGEHPAPVRAAQPQPRADRPGVLERARLLAQPFSSCSPIKWHRVQQASRGRKTPITRASGSPPPSTSSSKPSVSDPRPVLASGRQAESSGTGSRASGPTRRQEVDGPAGRGQARVQPPRPGRPGGPASRHQRSQPKPSAAAARADAHPRACRSAGLRGKRRADRQPTGGLLPPEAIFAVDRQRQPPQQV